MNILMTILVGGLAGLVAKFILPDNAIGLIMIILAGVIGGVLLAGTDARFLWSRRCSRLYRHRHRCDHRLHHCVQTVQETLADFIFFRHPPIHDQQARSDQERPSDLSERQGFA